MGIINFFDLTDSFTLPPDEAVEFFDSKGLQPTFSYLDMAAEEHDQAFTVAKMMDRDLLATTRDKLDQALSEGRTLQQFREELVPELQKAGWWGQKAMTDPVTGQTVTSQLGSNARLETIFRTNLLSSYSVGQWQKIEEQKEEAPLLMYDAVDDFRTRPTHAQWDERVFSVDDPFWSAWMPPNGFNCRCGVIQMDESEAGDFGLTPEGSPDLQREPWTNPRTGETRQVPKGIDPQFSHNPGLRRAQNTEQVSQEKFSILTPPEQQAIDLNQAAITSAQEASKRALINSPTGEKLQELSDQAAARTKQAKAAQEAAQAEIDKAIDQQTPWLAPAIKQVSKTQAAKDMNPAELLEEAKKKAKNNEQSALVANYKQNKINGKSISQSQQDAFDSLDETKRQAITEEIEVKSGNFQAKQQIEEFQSAAGFVAEKKAIKKLENEGALKGKEPKAQLKAIQEEAEAQKQAANQKALVNSYKANLVKGKNPTDAQAQAFNALPEADQKKLLDDVSAQKKQAEAQATLADMQKKAEGKPENDPLKLALKQAEETDGPATQQLSVFNSTLEEIQEELDEPAAPIPTSEDATDNVGPDMTQITQVGPAEGTNPGGRFLDQTTGQQWVIKTSTNPEIANNEVLAGKLYKAAGANAAEIERVDFKGNPAVASRVNPDARIDPATLRNGDVQGVKEDFAVDAWLANWDAVGEEFDNMMVAGNKAFRIDPGGSLRFRAQGGMKGQAFGDTVDEIKTLRDPNINPQAAEVFRDVTDDDIRAGVERIAAIDDDTIRELIQEYGPIEIKEQQALFNRLRARREDLKRRFPPREKTPVSEAAPKRATITENQVQRVRESGVTGFTVRTDLGDIEDHNVRLTHTLDADGNPFTRVTVQTTPEGKAKIQSKISDTEVSLAGLREKFDAAVAGINQQIRNSGEFREKDKRRLTELTDATQKAKNQLEAKLAAGESKEQVQKALEAIDNAEQTLRDVVIPLRKGETVSEMPFVPFREIPDITDESSTAFKVARENDKPTFPRMNPNEDGIPQETGQPVSFRVSRARNFEIDFDDGTRMQFFDDTSEEALDGLVDIKVPGKDAAAGSRALEILEEAGIDTTPPTQTDRRKLMLDQVAFRRFKGKDEGKLEQFNQLNTVDEKADFISQDAGFDIRQSPQWSNMEDAQAFGHGRQSLLRPDMDSEEFDQWAEQHALFHNPTGLDKFNELDEIENDLRNILNGGGSLTSLKDRVRRGLPDSDNAMERDFREGGASSVFTRIVKRNAKTAGFFWKPNRHMKRTDRITFDGDTFGSRQDGDLERHQDQVSDFKRNVKQDRDETFFKDGLSLFDDLDHIQTTGPKERQRVIDMLRDMGHDPWPDGRPVTEVVK